METGAPFLPGHDIPPDSPAGRIGIHIFVPLLILQYTFIGTTSASGVEETRTAALAFRPTRSEGSIWSWSNMTTASTTVSVTVPTICCRAEEASSVSTPV